MAQYESGLLRSRREQLKSFSALEQYFNHFVYLRCSSLRCSRLGQPIYESRMKALSGVSRKLAQMLRRRNVKKKEKKKTRKQGWKTRKAGLFGVTCRVKRTKKKKKNGTAFLVTQGVLCRNAFPFFYMAGIPRRPTPCHTTYPCGTNEIIK